VLGFTPFSPAYELQKIFCRSALQARIAAESRSYSCLFTSFSPACDQQKIFSCRSTLKGINTPLGTSTLKGINALQARFAAESRYSPIC